MNMRLPLDAEPATAPTTAQATPTPTLVLIHDAHGSPIEFASLTQILGNRAVTSDFLEVPGYTHDVERPTMAWRAWLRAASDVLDRRHGTGARIVLGGLGTGAALAAALAFERRSQQVCGLVLLSSTFTRTRPAVAESASFRIASTLGLDRWVSVAQCEPFGVRNAKTRKWIQRELDERGISSAGPARVALRVLRESDRLHAHVRATLAGSPSQLPMLVLHAADDDVAPMAGVAALVAQWGERAKLVALAHSLHRIAVDNDRQRVAHELADFAGAPKLASADRTAIAPARVASPHARRASSTYAAA